MPELNLSPDEEDREFDELVRDGNEDLYEGYAKYSKLSFIVKLYHIKCLYGMTNKAMSMIMELLSEAFEHARIPKNFYEAKKIINKLGLNCKKIHSCPNDCMLYCRNKDKHRQTCKVCTTSRWKSSGEMKPAKVLRYFPLKSCLQRLFMSSKTSKYMKWHKEGGNLDGLIRHPRDSKAWKRFDLKYPEFASDSRNLCLGLACVGFNLFGTLSTNYSIWPIILIPYNLPPWMCMKQTSFILSMIIPGKRMLGNDIDVYLQPLIKELNELGSDGIRTLDASNKGIFTMRATLMWTIDDFPGLGTLLGWNTHTGLACPSCNFDSIPCRLPFSKNHCSFLPLLSVEHVR